MEANWRRYFTINFRYMAIISINANAETPLIMLQEYHTVRTIRTSPPANYKKVPLNPYLTVLFFDIVNTIIIVIVSIRIRIIVVAIVYVNTIIITSIGIAIIFLFIMS
jgi:hypothetical protein